MQHFDDLAKTIDMASTKMDADLLITNCQFVDVYNQVLVDGPVAIGNGRIVGWGDHYRGKKELDAKGGIVMPGLIDGHVHIESSSLTPPQFARTILPFGTTTIIADPHEIANVCGLDGIRYMLNASKNLPLDVRLMLPSCVPATPFESAGAILEAEDLETLIHEERIHGLAEVMDYPSVIGHAKPMIDKILMAKKHDRVIDGHSPGVTGTDLMAYVASGIMTDHECSTPQAMIDRLRMGQYILLREGSTCKDLLNLLPALTPHNMRRCVFCTDDREANDILENGHLTNHLRLAVNAGIDPIMAITMGTLNAAECFRLYDKGAIAPGKDADLVIIDNLTDFRAKHVLVKGKEIARDEKLLVEIDDYIDERVLNTINIAPISESDFTLPLTSDTVRAIGVIPKSVVTTLKETHVVKNDAGEFDPKLNGDLNKLAVIERHHATGKIGLGVLSGYGIKNGAIAVSVAHDSHNLVVAGDNDRDMLAAVKDVEAIGGGFSIVQNGEVLAHLPLPVGGLMSNQSAQEVASALEELIRVAREKLALPDTFHPLMTLVFMTLPVIPELKLTSNGLFDVKQFKLVDLCIE